MNWEEMVLVTAAKIDDGSILTFLPQMSSEDLNQTDLKRGDLSVPRAVVSDFAGCRDTATNMKMPVKSS